MHADADRVSRGLRCRILRNEQDVLYVPPTVKEQSGRGAQGLGWRQEEKAMMQGVQSLVLLVFVFSRTLVR